MHAGAADRGSARLLCFPGTMHLFMPPADRASCAPPFFARARYIWRPSPCDLPHHLSRPTRFVSVSCPALWPSRSPALDFTFLYDTMHAFLAALLAASALHGAHASPISVTTHLSSLIGTHPMVQVTVQAAHRRATLADSSFALSNSQASTSLSLSNAWSVRPTSLSPALFPSILTLGGLAPSASAPTPAATTASVVSFPAPTSPVHTTGLPQPSSALSSSLPAASRYSSATSSALAASTSSALPAPPRATAAVAPAPALAAQRALLAAHSWRLPTAPRMGTAHADRSWRVPPPTRPGAPHPRLRADSAGHQPTPAQALVLLAACAGWVVVAGFVAAGVQWVRMKGWVVGWRAVWDDQ
jgi:hypothetical protein